MDNSLKVGSILIATMLLGGCGSLPRVILKPETVILIPHPVDCPEEPRIMVDPRTGEFMQSDAGEYVRDLREAHSICRQSKLLQDREIEELKRRQVPD